MSLKGSMYKSHVKSALRYGAECWALKKENERKLQTTEMRMLCMICGRTLKDGISNEITCEITGVEKLKKFFREQKMQWFGHIEKNELQWRKKKIVVNGSKRCRPKKRMKGGYRKKCLLEV